MTADLTELHTAYTSWFNTGKKQPDSMYQHGIKLKKYLKAKSFPKEWSDEMIIDFLAVYISLGWGAELKFLQEKYYSLFIAAYKKLCASGRYVQNHYFLLNHTLNLSYQIDDALLFPSYEQFLLRIKLIEDSYAYQRIPTIFENPQRFAHYTEHEEFLAHIVHCHTLFSYGLNYVDGGVSPMSNWLHYSSLFVLLLSGKHEEVLYKIVDPLTPRYEKRGEVRLIYTMLKAQDAKNPSVQKMVEYMRKSYPSEWLDTYVYSKDETPEENNAGAIDIYSLEGDQRVFIPYVLLKKTLTEDSVIYHYELCQTDFSFSNVRAVVLSGAYPKYTEHQRFELSEKMGELVIPLEHIKAENDKTWLRFEDQYRVYRWVHLIADGVNREPNFPIRTLAVDPRIKSSAD